jgi:hypothetical protein
VQLQALASPQDAGDAAGILLGQRRRHRALVAAPPAGGQPLADSHGLGQQRQRTQQICQLLGTQ